jgi:hypothetical protein
MALARFVEAGLQRSSGGACSGCAAGADADSPPASRSISLSSASRHVSRYLRSQTVGDRLHQLARDGGSRAVGSMSVSCSLQIAGPLAPRRRSAWWSSPGIRRAGNRSSRWRERSIDARTPPCRWSASPPAAGDRTLIPPVLGARDSRSADRVDPSSRRSRSDRPSLPSRASPAPRAPPRHSVPERSHSLDYLLRRPPGPQPSRTSAAGCGVIDSVKLVEADVPVNYGAVKLHRDTYQQTPGSLPMIWHLQSDRNAPLSTRGRRLLPAPAQPSARRMSLRPASETPIRVRSRLREVLGRSAAC